MESKGLILIFLCIIAGLYLKLDWLVILLVIFLFLVVLGSRGGARKIAKASKAEEVIYPVIYEDVGEPPFLYHPSSKIEVTPDWIPATQSARATEGMADIFRAAANIIRGKPKE